MLFAQDQDMIQAVALAIRSEYFADASLRRPGHPRLAQAVHWSCASRSRSIGGARSRLAHVASLHLFLFVLASLSRRS